LVSHRSVARRYLNLGLPAGHLLDNEGLVWIPMDHRGCRDASDQEAEQTVRIVRLLEENGVPAEEIKIITPYRAQENLIRTLLEGRAPVGTVDLFQGQEADVVIVSLSTSSGRDLTRQMSFFYSPNRLNVSITRARKKCIVLANRDLVRAAPRTVDDIRLMNPLCRMFTEAARRDPI
jgi:uncharacterized protein